MRSVRPVFIAKGSFFEAARNDFPIVKFLPVAIIIFLTIGTYGQNFRFKPVIFTDSAYRLPAKKLIIPAVLAGYGFAGLVVNPIKDLNLTVRREITSRVTEQCRIDDFTQWAPAGAVYGLNLLGIKGKHNLLDRSVILGTALVTMAISVNGMKLLTHIQRPDGTAFNAFPSGHTATAFAGAEFLYQEYKDVSVWYGIAGYTIAAGTGFMRMYNNRHWLSDVVAGAGFGIISSKLAYWVFPKIKKLFFKDIQLSFSLVPSVDFGNRLVH